MFTVFVISNNGPTASIIVEDLLVTSSFYTANLQTGHIHPVLTVECIFKTIGLQMCKQTTIRMLIHSGM